MEEFLVPPYNFGAFPGYFPFYPGNGKIRNQGWSKKGSHFYGPPETQDYFDVYKRAQLKAILSQVNPNLTPRLRRANTKEFGVQVNPKVDVTVQCSLGPKTLFYHGDETPCGSSGSLIDALPNTPTNSVRFSRPVAIYSPVFDRRNFSFPAAGPEGEPDCEVFGEREETPLLPSEPQQKSVIRRNQRSNFQFLEQKYGFYHCSKCNIRWESAFVWCISGTSKVYFKQLCRKCQAGLNPYHVETIQCQVCCKTRCCCERKLRHVDMRRPHRQDLCGRCKGKGLSCDAIYSFKYIV